MADALLPMSAGVVRQGLTGGFRCGLQGRQVRAVGTFVIRQGGARRVGAWVGRNSLGGLQLGVGWAW